MTIAYSYKNSCEGSRQADLSLVDIEIRHRVANTFMLYKKYEALSNVYYYKLVHEVQCRGNALDG